MLIAALVALLAVFGASGGHFGELMTKYVKKPIEINVADKERRESALTRLSVLKDDLKSLNHQVSDDLKQFDKLIKNYDSKPDDFDKLFSSTLERRDAELRRIWQHRNAMLEYIKPDEWQRIIGSAKKKMSE